MYFEKISRENRPEASRFTWRHNAPSCDVIGKDARNWCFQCYVTCNLWNGFMKGQIMWWKTLFAFNIHFRVESYHQEAIQRVENMGDTLVRRMLIELESGGNVRFEEGSPSDVWWVIPWILSGRGGVSYGDTLAKARSRLRGSPLGFSYPHLINVIDSLYPPYGWLIIVTNSQMHFLVQCLAYWNIIYYD